MACAVTAVTALAVIANTVPTTHPAMSRAALGMHVPASCCPQIDLSGSVGMSTPNEVLASGQRVPSAQCTGAQRSLLSWNSERASGGG